MKNKFRTDWETNPMLSEYQRDANRKAEESGLRKKYNKQDYHIEPNHPKGELIFIRIKDNVYSLIKMNSKYYVKSGVSLVNIPEDRIIYVENSCIRRYKED